MTVESGGFSQEMLQVCAANYVVTLNGPNFAFITNQSGTMGRAQGQLGQEKRLNADGYPTNDTEFVSVALLNMELDDKVKIGAWANNVLESLWPYPVCNKYGAQRNCTRFPLKPNRQVADKVLGKARSSYFCMWGVVHTLLENGAEHLTHEQIKANQQLIKLYATAHSCQVCRTNFAHLMEHFGTPTSQKREDHAAWWWTAHNNANEHAYSVHSYQSPLAPRVGDWANPQHMGPWYTPREDAKKIWKIRASNQ